MKRSHIISAAFVNRGLVYIKENGESDPILIDDLYCKCREAPCWAPFLYIVLIKIRIESPYLVAKVAFMYSKCLTADVKRYGML